MNDIYSFTKKPIPPPLTGAGSSATLRSPSHKRISSTEVVAMIGLVVILAVAVTAYVEVRFGVHGTRRHDYPITRGDMQTNQQEIGIDVLPIRRR
ncbi:MAG: hypothetical protein KKC51_01330 [Verrucomicrobia bacterium]|nr:hypothetical protein [Verrucomicrobiota bacterium]